MNIARASRRRDGSPEGATERGEAPRVAVIQWNGEIGGSEALSVTLTTALRRLGTAAEILFVTHSGSLSKRLDSAGVPFRNLGLARGRDVLLHPARFAAAVASCGHDGALLPECGYLGAALRAGGYRAPIVAMEHGALIKSVPGKLRRSVRLAGRVAGAWADDVEVGVSDFMLAGIRAHPRCKRTVRIYNGVDPDTFKPRSRRATLPGDSLVIGFAGRLRPGKGADCLLRGFAEMRARMPGTLLLAGDGPQRPTLVSLANRLGVQDHVQFLGWADDLPDFWSRCDVAVFPTDGLPESFGMTALEAMACGKPVIASRIGALPEIVADGVTGRLCPPGDISALGSALIAYGADSELRRAHAAAARERAVEMFHIDDCARAYRDLFRDIARSRRTPAPTGTS